MQNESYAYIQKVLNHYSLALFLSDGRIALKQNQRNNDITFTSAAAPAAATITTTTTTTATTTTSLQLLLLPKETGEKNRANIDKFNAICITEIIACYYQCEISDVCAFFIQNGQQQRQKLN